MKICDICKQATEKTIKYRGYLETEYQWVCADCYFERELKPRLT